MKDKLYEFNKKVENHKELLHNIIYLTTLVKNNNYIELLYLFQVSKSINKEALSLGLNEVIKDSDYYLFTDKRIINILNSDSFNILRALEKLPKTIARVFYSNEKILELLSQLDYIKLTNDLDIDIKHILIEKYIEKSYKDKDNKYIEIVYSLIKEINKKTSVIKSNEENNFDNIDSINIDNNYIYNYIKSDLFLSVKYALSFDNIEFLKRIIKSNDIINNVLIYIHINLSNNINKNKFLELFDNLNLLNIKVLDFPIKDIFSNKIIYNILYKIFNSDIKVNDLSSRKNSL